MKRVTVAVLSLLCVAATARAGDSPLRLTVQQLLATPEKFVGKRVDVTGWYLAVHEDSNLFASERAVDGNLDHSIWLQPDTRVGNRTVRVIGTFHYQPRP